MNKEEGKESICSCSPNTRPPCSSSGTRPACSSSATSSCSSSNIRPNLRKRKRRRIHMANKKAVDDLDKRMSDILGEGTIRKLERERELRRTWELHHDELINLLEAHCNGVHNLGNTKDKKFWKTVTYAMVSQFGLKLDVDEETCESCMKYVQSLQKVYNDYKGKKKAIEKIQKTQSNLASPELISGLRKIFSEKISFKRVSSVGKTSMTSRSSSSAKRRSNSSVNQQIIDKNLIKDVEAALSNLAVAEAIDSKDLKEVKSYILSEEMLCTIFLLYTDEQRVDAVKQLVTKCNTHS